MVVVIRGGASAEAAAEASGPASVMRWAAALRPWRPTTAAAAAARGRAAYEYKADGTCDRRPNEPCAYRTLGRAKRTAPVHSAKGRQSDTKARHVRS